MIKLIDILNEKVLNESTKFLPSFKLYIKKYWNNDIGRFFDNIMIDNYDKEDIKNIEDNYNDWKQRHESYMYPLTIYRAIILKDISDIDYNNIGTYWTPDIDYAKPYNVSGGDNKYILIARVNKDDINWGETLMKNVSSIGEDENEITLLKNKNILIQYIIDANNKKIKVNKMVKT